MSRETRVNERIKVKKIRVISVDGKQLGIMPLEEGLALAGESSLDLVEVAPDANPPVCRIMDYGKYRYEQSKRARESRKKQTSQQIKEVKMRPNISDHDYGFKSRHAVRFLKAGDKVKVTIMFRGREITHKELGRQLLERLASDLEEIASVERRPGFEGRYDMSMVLTPR